MALEPEVTPAPTLSPKESAKRAEEIAAFEDKVRRRVQARTQEFARVKKETERRRLPIKLMSYSALIVAGFFLVVYNWDMVGKFAAWLAQYSGVRVKW